MSAPENPMAFPSGDFTGCEPGYGMTLRDWFAGQWLAGYCATQSDALWTSRSFEQVAKAAYLAADAMLTHSKENADV